MAAKVVAVTGIDTFFGRRLVEALEADPQVGQVLAIAPRPPARSGPKTRFERIDLVHPRSAEQLSAALQASGAQVLVHTAFLARPTHRGGWAHELEAIGTRHVLAAVEAAGTPHLVLRSSTLSYGALPSHPAQIGEQASLAGGAQSSFVADKIEAEVQCARFAQRHPDRVVTILRFAPLLGPSADTIATLYLRRRVCPTLLGFDPLIQLVHEEDAIEATRLALHGSVRGAVNVGAPGVLPLSTVVRLAGARTLPLPGGVLRRASMALWAAQLGDFPPGLLDFLKYASVADLTRMREQLGFRPRHDIRGAIAAFAGARSPAPGLLPP